MLITLPLTGRCGEDVPQSVELEGGGSPRGGLSKTFCGECGSALFGRDPETKVISIVRMAAIDGGPGVRPMARQFVAYAAPWEPIPDDGLPRFDERAPG